MRLSFCFVQSIDRLIDAFFHADFFHVLLAMEGNLSDIHRWCFLQILPHRVDNVDIVHFIAVDAVGLH